MSRQQRHTSQFRLGTDDGQLPELMGIMNTNLRQIEEALGVRINNRGGNFRLTGASEDAVRTARGVLEQLHRDAANGTVEPGQVQRLVVHLRSDAERDESVPSIRTPRANVRASGRSQQHYVRNLVEKPLVFGVGAAGTGKTFLAVAMAVQALQEGQVQRIVLTRPAVEAGEKLGFLPGDLGQKLDPYLRPLYDALRDTLGVESVARLMSSDTIEIAPLAYMRGRTLSEAYVVLDEAQNTTVEQMKMFLTRLGINSRAVVTGDLSQVDLPTPSASGLRHALETLQDIEEIGICHFGADDAMRHPLVRRIIKAYAAANQSNQSQQK